MTPPRPLTRKCDATYPYFMECEATLTDFGLRRDTYLTNKPNHLKEMRG